MKLGGQRARPAAREGGDCIALPGVRVPAAAGPALLGGGLLAVCALALHVFRLPNGLPAFDPLGLLILAAWGAWVAVDERAFGPLGVSEPLAAALLAGICTRQVPEAVALGVSLQAIWPGLVPMGGSRQPAAGLGALAGVGWLVLLPAAFGVWRFPLALAAALACSAWGDVAELRLRARNGVREERVWAQAGVEPPPSIGCLIQSGIIESAARGVGAVVLFVALPALGLRVLAVLRGGDPSGLAQGASGQIVWQGSILAALFGLGGLVRERGVLWVRGSRHSARLGRRSAVTAPVGERCVAPACPQPRFSVIMRLLALQAAFSARYLQRSGFWYSLGRDLCGRRSKMSEALRCLGRDLARACPANTHPVMAAALVGAVGRVIEERDAGESPRPAVRLIEVGGPVLAQWGDRFLWGAVRPALALLALAATALTPLAGLGLLALSAMLHIAGRVFLFRWGWSEGWGLVRSRAGWLWQNAPVWGERSLAALGLLAALALVWLGVKTHLHASGLWVAGFILGGCLRAGVFRRPLVWGCAAGLATCVGTGLQTWFVGKW